MGNDFWIPSGYRSAVVMPRPPGIPFAGANYHIVTRGDGRHKLLHDDGHYGRFTDGLQLTFGDTPPTAGARGCSIDCGASSSAEVAEDRFWNQVLDGRCCLAMHCGRPRHVRFLHRTIGGDVSMLGSTFGVCIPRKPAISLARWRPHLPLPLPSNLPSDRPQVAFGQRGMPNREFR